MFLAAGAQGRKTKHPSERSNAQAHRECDSADIFQENTWRHLSIMAPIVYHGLGAKWRREPRGLKCNGGECMVLKSTEKYIEAPMHNDI